MTQLVIVAKKISDITANIAKVVIIGMMGVMAVVIIAQVYMRYVAKSPFPWSEELARFLMAWIAFLGAGMGIRIGSHVGVELFVRKLFSSRMQLWISLLIKIPLFALFFVLIKEGYFLCHDIAFQRSPALMVSMAWPYASVPVGSFFMFLQFLPSFFENLRDIIVPLPEASSTPQGEVK